MLGTIPRGLQIRSDKLIIPALLCGGSGTRLWPLSQAAVPKQFLSLVEDRTLLQATALRTAGRPDFGPMLVLANSAHRFLVAEQLRELGIEQLRVVLEPAVRNTAAAAAVAAMLAVEIDPDALVLLMPTDHVIGDADAFLAAIDAGAPSARKGELVLFGVRPDRPATGYGYIEIGEALDPPQGRVHRVGRFIEKPSPSQAEDYLAAKNFLWNSGIFLLPAHGFLQEMQRLAPEVLAAAEEAVRRGVPDADFLRLDPAAFAAAPAISIDHAIFEKTGRAVVVSVDMKWTDIGSWSAVWDFASKDAAGNVTVGAVHAEKTSSSYLRSEGPRLVSIGMKNVIIVATPEAVLVVDKAHDQEVKGVVARIKAGHDRTPAEEDNIYADGSVKVR